MDEHCGPTHGRGKYVALFDFLRRKDRSRQRESGARPVVDRRPDQATVQIKTPPVASPASATRPGTVRTSAPAATAVTPRAEPIASHPAPTAPVPTSASETEYVDVRKILHGRVVGVLVAIEGDLEGEVYRIFNGENRLGRSADCEIELPSRKISREHAKILHEGGRFVVTPLSDKNPTILNDEATERAELGDGDTLELGRTKFRFRSV